MPHQHSVGRAIYFSPVQLYDRRRGKLADFTTQFGFVVNPKGSANHGGGLSFFMVPLHSDISIPNNSAGGMLGLFSPETAFNISKNRIVSVKFDSFANEWDPFPGSQFPHVGININSLKSVETAPWKSNSEPEGAIHYESSLKKLGVFVTYPHGSEVVSRDSTVLTHTTDLSTVMPEYVLVGFSAAGGDLVETHDIIYWTFSSSL